MAVKTKLQSMVRSLVGYPTEALVDKNCCRLGYTSLRLPSLNMPSRTEVVEAKRTRIQRNESKIFPESWEAIS